MRLPLWLGFFLLLQLTVRAQNFNFETFSVRDGLPQSQVFCLHEDGDGFLWIGTADGLARFDGAEFVRMTRVDGLCANWITAIAEDSLHNLWVTTQLGLSMISARQRRTNSPTARCFDLQAYISEPSLNDATVDLRGDLWISSNSGALKVASAALRMASEGGPLQVADLAGHPIARTPLWNCQSTRGDSVILWGDDWLWVVADDTIRKLSYPNANARHDANSIMVDQQSGLWTFQDSELLRLQGSTFVQRHFPELPDVSPGKSRMQTIHKSADGTLWMGGHGIIVATKAGRTRLFKASQGLNAFGMSALLTDRSGDLWIGANGGSLQRLLDDGWSCYDAGTGLTNDFVLAIERDANGVLHAGTIDGLFRLDPASGRWLRHTRFGKDIEILSLHRDPADRLWVGTRLGVGYFEGASFKMVQELNLSRNEYSFGPQVITSDTTGTVWIGLEGELLRYRDGQMRRYPIPFSSWKGFIRAIYTVDGRSIHVGGQYIGLVHLQLDSVSGDIASIRQLIPDDGDNGQAVRSIACLPDGSIWAGMLGGGLFWATDTKDGRVREADGLHSDMVFQLCAGPDGDLWIGSSRGLMRLDGKAFAESRKIRLREVPAGTQIGGVEFNTGASHVDPDGTLWLGTVKGLLRRHAAGAAQAPAPPLLHIAGIEIDQQDSLYLDGATLPREPTLVNCRFRAVSLRAPEDIRYRHRLIGLDSAWSALSTERSASYLQLPPGAYTFEVRAEVGEVQTKPARIHFSIPSGGSRTGLIAAGLLLLAGLAYAVFRMRRPRPAGAPEAAAQAAPTTPASTQFFVKVGTRMVRLDSRTCRFIKGAGDYVEIHTEDKKHLVRASMKGILTELPDPESFLRVHRSWIIRLDKITAVREHNVEIEGTQIPIAESYRETFRNHIDFRR